MYLEIMKFEISCHRSVESSNVRVDCDGKVFSSQHLEIVLKYNDFEIELPDAYRGQIKCNPIIFQP